MRKKAAILYSYLIFAFVSCGPVRDEPSKVEDSATNIDSCASVVLDSSLARILLATDIDDSKLDLLDSYYLADLFYLKNVEPDFFAQSSIHILLSYHKTSLESLHTQGIPLVKEAHNHISVLLFLDSYTALSKNFDTSSWTCEIYIWAKENKALLCIHNLEILNQLDSIAQFNRLDIKSCIE